MPRRLPQSRKVTAYVRQGMQDYIAWCWKQYGAPPGQRAIAAEVWRLILEAGPTPPLGRARLSALHRNIYRRCYGPVPEGHEIHHIDGDHNNNDPKNLVAITAEEHRDKHPHYRRVPIPQPDSPFYGKP